MQLTGCHVGRLRFHVGRLRIHVRRLRFHVRRRHRGLRLDEVRLCFHVGRPDENSQRVVKMPSFLSFFPS